MINFSSIKTRLARDSGENSIMQTISIAVSAILIAAGLITAPSLINNARDVNAKSDLASVAYGEEFANSNTGAYLPITTVAQIASFRDSNGNSTDGAVKTTLSAGGPNSAISVKLDAAVGYVAVIRSQSGTVFYRTGTSTTIRTATITGTPAALASAGTVTFVLTDLVTIP